MQIPFTPEQFVEVFKNYNETVFPAQLIFYVILVVLGLLLWRRQHAASGSIAYALAFFWFWMGIVYHITFFADINKAAYAFGGLFIAESLLFVWLSGTLSFKLNSDGYNVVGYLLIFYSLIGYPLVGYSIGHVYPLSPTFGLPCPTTIFTFGLLLLNDKKVPVVLFIIPFLWALIGTSAAFSLGFYEDVGLFIAAVVAVPMIWVRNKKFNVG